MHPSEAVNASYRVLAINMMTVEVPSAWLIVHRGLKVPEPEMTMVGSVPATSVPSSCIASTRIPAETASSTMSAT